MSAPHNPDKTAPRPHKRYITTHDHGTGKSVYMDEKNEKSVRMTTPFGTAVRSFATSSLPAQPAGDEDVKAFKATEGVASYARPEIVVPGEQRAGTEQGQTVVGGSTLFVMDFVPGSVGHWHRTVSLDYSICVEGEIEHELDGGEKVVLLPGVSFLSRSYPLYPS